MRLKSGDSFIYTKRMNDEKLKSPMNSDASDYIGKRLVVWFVGNGFYSEKTTGHGFYFSIRIIDDNLDSVTRYYA